MTKRLRGFISFLLVLVLCFGMIPNVSAAEIGATESIVETEATEATTAATTAPPDETSPTETSGETSPPTEEFTESTQASVPVTDSEDGVFSDIGIQNEAAAASTDDYGIMTAASTQSGILLFDFADNGNYTTVLNSQLTVKYKPNGTGTTRTAYIKNLGWHFARYNNVPYADDPLYCIEPWRNYAASTSGNSVDRDVTLSGSGSTTGSNVWYALPAARREAIGLILLYSNQMWDHSISVTTTSKANNPNVPLRIATQFLIYEIVCGLRDAETFTLNSTNESGTAGDIFYNAGVDAVSYFAPNYNTLVSYVQSAMEIPSFTSASSSSAPTIELEGEETAVYDSNGVLSNFTIKDGNGAEFYKSGNTLYIYQTGTISESTVFKATRYIPSAANSTYNLWYMSGSSYQTTISLASPSTGSLNAYFKLKSAPATGDLSLVKTTEDSKNLSGWQFGIYSNSACTSLVSGPYTTNSTGKISVTGLSAGTYYVKELGHTDSTIDAMYSCASTNPQKVTISSGQTATVSFHNELDPSGLNLTKTTEDGKNLAGWQFGIYSDSACATLISGPHTTDSSGKISVADLSAGTVYVRELGHTDSSIHALYTCSGENPQKVVLTPGQTTTVSFHNTLNTGGVKLVKETNTGANLGGWQIGLYYDADCTQSVDGSPFTTAADGTVSVTGLMPGTLYAKEIPTEDPYWAFDTEVKTVTVETGKTATVTFTNTHYGRIEFRKTTNTGNHLGGWTFRVKDSNFEVVGEYTTDENGYACTENLPLGRYTVVELPTEDNYWSCELGFHDVTVKAGETVVDEWLNKEQGLGWFYKKTNTGESVEGWHITIYADEACTQEVRTVITNEDGRVGYYMDPGVYWAKETGDEYGRFEDEYWMVDETVQKFEIKPHEDVSITFTNVQYGKVKIIKTMESQGSVADWQFKVTDADGKEIEGSPFTSDESGVILSKVLPGQYTIEELIPEDSLYCCISKNPQTVTVTQGEVAEVTFTNALRPGKITLDKVDIKGNSLAGATFLLEWSEDGSLWWPIEYSDSEILQKGCCSNTDIEDGCLTTGADGKLEWDNLHPGLQYRLTETEAPRGYTKLRKAAFEGQLPEEDHSLEVKVINSRSFTLPETGSVSLLLSSISMSGCLLGLICSYLTLRKKEQ